MSKKWILPAADIPESAIIDKIDKRCEICAFWYKGFCTIHKQPTFPDGLCESYRVSKILPSK